MKKRKMSMTAEEETCFLYVGGGVTQLKYNINKNKEMTLLTEEDNFNRA